MKLYITPGSPYARMARIMVLEKGLTSRVETIVAKTRTADSPYYRINPSGRVPYLICDDGVRLEESALICAYLDHLDGKPAFDLPAGDQGWEPRRLEALARSMMDGLSVWVREILRPENERSPGVIRHEADRARRIGDLWETEIDRGYMHGELIMVQITLACALGLEARIADYRWRTRHPKLCRWFDQIAARPSFAATAPPNDSVAHGGLPRPGIPNMALLGKAAMVLSFDIAPEAIVEHDDWHTHEHMPERLSIPGFLRGSRWTALSGQPRYLVMYEVREIGTLSSAPYLERLNDPSPWTRQMMVHYRGMIRGFCEVTRSAGLGMGQSCLLIRFKPVAGKEAPLRDWLAKTLAGVAAKPGLASAHLLEAASTPPNTNEQRIRGSDAAVDWVLLVTGYSAGSVAALSEGEFSKDQLERQGAAGIVAGVYRMEYSLTDREVATTDPAP